MPVELALLSAGTVSMSALAPIGSERAAVATPGRDCRPARRTVRVRRRTGRPFSREIHTVVTNAISRRDHTERSRLFGPRIDVRQTSEGV